MFVPFETLPPTSRVWIFQAERKFTFAELTIISSGLELFTNTWSAHGQPLQTSFQIREDRFIILAVDENLHQASGCSIDDSTHTIKEIGNLIHQDLFRRDLVSFSLGDKVETVKLSDLKNLFNNGVWNENTLTFNTLAGDKMQLESEWLVPAKKTWLKRYIVNEGITH
jgi:hypothetical protein